MPRRTAKRMANIIPENVPSSRSLVVHDYSDAEREFMVAMDRFKIEKRKPFPSWAEVLSVLLSLGYRKAEGESK